MLPSFQAGVVAVALLVLLALPATLRAQEQVGAPPSPALAFESLGQPWRLKPYAAGSLTWDREGQGRLGGVGVICRSPGVPGYES